MLRRQSAAEIEQVEPESLARAVAEHLGGVGDLAQLGLGVEGKQPDALGVPCGDVRRALDRVAERQLRPGDAETAAARDLAAAGDIEAGADPRQPGDDLRRRIGLYRVIDLRGGQQDLQGVVLCLDKREIEHEAGRRRSHRPQEGIDPRCRWHLGVPSATPSRGSAPLQVTP